MIFTDDIQVRFVEQDSEGCVKWEAYGNFGPLDVHRQVSICRLALISTNRRNFRPKIS